MSELIASIGLWVIEHQPTIQAIAITALVAFIAGMAWQFCLDDRQADQDKNKNADHFAE